MRIGCKFFARTLAVALCGAAATPALAQVGCGADIGPGSRVVLGEPLACATGAAIVIVRGPAELDLNGFSITCTANAAAPRVGILLLGAGAEVRNGAIVGCDNGLVAAGTGRHLIDAVAVRDGLRDGIVLASDANRVRGAVVSFQDGAGIVLRGRDNVVRDSAATGNRVGFRVARRGTLLRNVATANERDGFLVDGTGVQLVDNRAVGSRLGFVVAGAEGRLVRNEARENVIGIFVDDRARENALVANVATRNIAAGIVAAGTRNRLVLNRAADNVTHGLRVTTAASALAISGTVARRNGALDLTDDTPGCGGNRWRNNRFETRNQTCVE